MVQLDTNGECASFLFGFAWIEIYDLQDVDQNVPLSYPSTHPSVKNSKYPKNTYKVSYNVKYNVPTHLICTALELNVFGNDTCIEKGDW